MQISQDYVNANVNANANANVNADVNADTDPDDDVVPSSTRAGAPDSHQSAFTAKICIAAIFEPISNGSDDTVAVVAKLPIVSTTCSGSTPSQKTIQFWTQAQLILRYLTKLP